MDETIKILAPHSCGSFQNRLDDLYSQTKAFLEEEGLGLCDLFWCRAYLSDAANQSVDLLNHKLYQEILSKGAFSYIEQPPMDGSKISLMMSFIPGQCLLKKGTPDKMKITCGNTTYFYQSVRLTEAESENFTTMGQTMLCFEKHIEWLGENGLTLKDNCMRTWLYVRDIDCNYAEVMKGRNTIFDKHGLTQDTHFIASTGIEGYGSHSKATICMDFLSLQSADNMRIKYLQAPEYLNPTYQYGVAFERGTSFHVNNCHKLLLSGTASINKQGKCIFVGDVERQAERMLVNMDQLLKADGASIDQMKYFTVYLRDISDYETIRDFMTTRFPHIPVIVLHAPVCRPGWLVEAEGEVSLTD